MLTKTYVLYFALCILSEHVLLVEFFSLTSFAVRAVLYGAGFILISTRRHSDCDLMRIVVQQSLSRNVLYPVDV